MALITDQGICIRVWDWSETSQTVSVFGRTTGVIRGVAKGAKREHAKFSGGLEVMTRGEFVASIKNTEDMALLTAWDLQETFPAARATLSAFYAGMTMLDLVHRGVQDHDPHPALFDALLGSLRELGSAEQDRWALLRFLWTVLVETGHQPELRVDVSTGAELETAKSYAFNARRGGLMKDTLHTSTPAHQHTSTTDGVWRVRAETVELLRTLGGSKWEVGSGKAEVGTGASVQPTSDISQSRRGDPHPTSTVDRATRLLALYFREVFACELPSMRQALARE